MTNELREEKDKNIKMVKAYQEKMMDYSSNFKEFKR